MVSVWTSLSYVRAREERRLPWLRSFPINRCFITVIAPVDMQDYSVLLLFQTAMTKACPFVSDQGSLNSPTRASLVRREASLSIGKARFVFCKI